MLNAQGLSCCWKVASKSSSINPYILLWQCKRDGKCTTTTTGHDVVKRLGTIMLRTGGTGPSGHESLQCLQCRHPRGTCESIEVKVPIRIHQNADAWCWVLKSLMGLKFDFERFTISPKDLQLQKHLLCYESYSLTNAWTSPSSKCIDAFLYPAWAYAP